MPKDIISEVIEDHNVIKDLNSRYNKEMDACEKQKIANTIVREIAVHSAAEEICAYPLIEKHLIDGKKIADKSREEHLQLKKDLYELDQKKVQDEGYETLLKKICDVKNEIYPKLKDSLNEKILKEEGEKYEKTRSTVPTRPHPSAPDQPPLETAAGMAQAPIDKGLDLTREFVKTIRE
ncbi:6324_t:CDS:2 [Scutellospora calospora]|uniref:6324_t:CDS:1 n=1 Tax=Scutellospora calospora TaxID=85575 RepID=A0ACA9N8S2_9GLOM|nr:6324_t:CDS:2 [Scutellospora calospora]